jgi:SAM-dependent methyltransferase
MKFSAHPAISGKIFDNRHMVIMETSGKEKLFEYLISRLEMSPARAYSILDFGCGKGDFLGLVSQYASAESRLIGIDASERFIHEAKAGHPAIHFICKKIDTTIDLPDGSLDSIVTIDVFECIGENGALIHEFHRILKPGGTVLAAHWDWDTMLYNAECKDIARKATAAFSDWKQPWMDHCDGRMGRKLWGLFEGSGKFRGHPDSFNLIETSYRAGAYGFDRMQDIAQLIDKGGIGKEEHEKLHRELIDKDGKGQYFFSLTSFLYCGKKI